MENRTDSEVFAAVIVNTLLPILMFCVSYSLQKTKLQLYLARMGEASCRLGLERVLKIIPQALFFIDEKNEEILD